MTTAEKEKTIPIDLLGRQEIVDRIMSILEIISEGRASCTFALNGAWGTGKTFVLNILRNQLWEYHSDDYIVFHYNCWQYDYYEEPLIAIVAAMLDSVDEENHLIPANLREKARAGMEMAKPVLKKIATDFVKNKIGVDLTDVVSATKDYGDALNNEEKKQAESRSFDEFYSFKKAIQQAQEEIKKLTKDRTLVVIVDELDRCLPNYAIKVLERLHHLFEDIKNTTVVLGVDKSQLDRTIKQLFGSNTDTSHYLRKFIDFEIELSDSFVDDEALGIKYSALFDSFLYSFELVSFSIETYIAALFTGIPIRTTEQIIHRIDTVNRILFRNEDHDVSFLCCELLWIVLTEVHGYTTNCPLYYSKGFRLENTLDSFFKFYFNENWSNHYIEKRENSFDSNIWLEGNGTMQKLIIFYLSSLYAYINHEEAQYRIDTTEYDPFFSIDYNQNLEDLKKAIDLLSIIK